MTLGSFGTQGTRKREVRGSAEFGRCGEKTGSQMLLGHVGRKYAEYTDMIRPNQDEKGTTGPGELGTCGTKSSDGPEKNRLR
ncbi:hypothetical protein KI387_037561, partial [Taxus chinensis]